MKNNRKEITILSLVIVFVLTILLSSSYAWFTVTAESNNTTTIKVGDLDLAFTDNNQNVELLNKTPIPIDDAFEEDGYTFTLTNTGSIKSKYTVVLEETSDYAKHNVNRRLANEYIDYSIYAEGKKIDGTLNNNLKFSSEYNGIDKTNNTYLLYEGTLKKLETSDIQIGFWVSYENITNEYMNSAFIGTLKIYME